METSIAEPSLRAQGWLPIAEVVQDLEQDIRHVLVQLLNLIVLDCRGDDLEELSDHYHFWFTPGGELCWMRGKVTGGYPATALVGDQPLRVKTIAWIDGEWLTGSAHTFVNFSEAEWSASPTWEELALTLGYE